MAIAEVAANAPSRRIPAIDIARGVAIAGMVVYHFAWDLWAFGLVQSDVGFGPYWRLFAHTIAVTFLTLVGIGLVLAFRDGAHWERYLRRLGFIVAGALAVSVATWFADAGTFVFFGILHLIALSTVLAVPFLTAPAWVTAIAGVAAMAVGNWVVTPALDPIWLVWLGMSQSVPATVDYYPLFPWFGVVLLGVAAGRLMLATGTDATLARWGPSDPVSRTLGLAGRWSLVIYLVHQLVLYGGVSLWAEYIAPPPPVATAQPTAGEVFMNDCIAGRGRAGADAASAATYCACMYSGLSSAGLTTVAPGDLTADQRTQFATLTQRCAAAVPATKP